MPSNVAENKVQAHLIKKLNERSATIGVIGLGYVGLPLSLAFAEAGYRVIGVDSDPKKAPLLNRGESYIKHIPAARVAAARARDFEATTDTAALRAADAVILCVPTPLNRYREPDLSFIINTTESLLPYLHAGQIISLESTTYPGTTEEELKPRIEKCGFVVGQDIFLVFAPEREDPGNQKFALPQIPKICGGITPVCLEVGMALYRQVVKEVVPVSSAKAAEMTKLLENIHRAVNIGLANEMKIIADRMGIDIHEVIRAAATKPFGFVPYYPGPGLGGHCIPIDPFYLTWKARAYGLHTRFIELAGEINTAMPEWVIGKIADALNDRQLALRGSRILVLGLAYKKNVDDTSESPAAEIIELLLAKGALVDYADPHVPIFPSMCRHKLAMKSVDVTPTTLGRYDCVVIVTNHDAFDYDCIRKHAKLIVDTRGVYLEPAPNIIKA